MWLYSSEHSDCNPYTEAPFVEVTQISRITCVLPWNIYPHFHDGEYEVIIIFRGFGQMMIPGDSFRIEPGTIAVIPPDMAHYLLFDPESEDDVEYLAMHFHPGKTPYYPGCPEGQYMERIYTDHPGRYRRLMEHMEEITKENGRLIDGRVQTLLLLFAEEIRREPSASREIIQTFTSENAREIFLYLSRHIHEKITLQDLSERFAMSQSHLSRVFLQTYHVSPINYLIYSRMRRARTYILEENLTPRELASKLAYRTTWQFSQAFEKFFGKKPEEYLEYAIRENADME